MDTEKQSANKRPRGGVEGRPSEGGILDHRTRRARRRRELVAVFSDALGGAARLSDAQRIAIKKAAELTALAEDARAMALQSGPVTAGSMDLMVRLQSASERAIRMLRLPDHPGPSKKKYGMAEPVPAASLADYLAGHGEEK